MLTASDLQAFFDRHRSAAHMIASKKENLSLLMLLCKYGFKDIAVRVLDCGAELDLCDSQGLTAAEYALRAGQSACFDLLRDRGAQMDAARMALSSQGVKVALVGDPAAGKTTLIQRLVAADNSKSRIFPPDYVATDGVVVTDLIRDTKSGESEKVPLSFFDFGGQATLFATHQLFLSPGSVFILVVDISLDNHLYLEYWAEQIARHKAIDSMVLVCTHSALVKKAKFRAEFRQRLRRSHVAVSPDSVFVLDLKKISNKDFTPLIALLQRLATKLSMVDSPFISTPVISLFLRLSSERTRLKSDPSLPRWIDWKEYERLARGAGLSSELEVQTATAVLVKRGVLMTMRHELTAGRGASNLVILDPAWLAAVFSAVVSIKFQESSYRYLGLVASHRVHAGWRELGITESLFPDLEGILSLFELAVLVDGDEKFFVPSNGLAAAPVSAS